MIRIAKKSDCLAIAKLALELWPHHTLEELILEFQENIQSEHAVIFLFFDEKILIAFAHCSLRYDYVEGTTSRPVAYLEGIYVKKEHRLKGIGKSLLKECEKWAKKKTAKK